MLTAIIALIGVIIILISAFVRPATFGLTAVGAAIFLLGWAVLPMFGVH